MKPHLMTIALMLLPLAGHAQDIHFGDDSGSYANDDECDDRRFRGPGMSSELGWEDTTRDANDCKALYDAGRIALWLMPEAIAATDCKVVDFGSNASEYADDGACDDPRFEGMGMAEFVSTDDLRADANDCRRLCDFGMIGLRDY